MTEFKPKADYLRDLREAKLTEAQKADLIGSPDDHATPDCLIPEDLENIRGVTALAADRRAHADSCPYCQSLLAIAFPPADSAEPRAQRAAAEALAAVQTASEELEVAQVSGASIWVSFREFVVVAAIVVAAVFGRQWQTVRVEADGDRKARESLRATLLLRSPEDTPRMETLKVSLRKRPDNPDEWARLLEEYGQSSRWAEGKSVLYACKDFSGSNKDPDWQAATAKFETDLSKVNWEQRK